MKESNTKTAKPATTKRATRKTATKSSELLFAVSKTGGKDATVSYANIAGINPPSATELGAASAALQDARLALIAHNCPELVDAAKVTKGPTFARALDEYFGCKVANADRSAARLILTTDVKTVVSAWNAHVESKKRFSDIISLQAVAKVLKAGEKKPKAPTLKERLQKWADENGGPDKACAELPQSLADILLEFALKAEPEEA